MKVGLFFGTFNPIHVGHLVVAGYMTEFTDLKEVWFVVSPQNPMKAEQNMLEENQRLALVNLAVGNHPKLKVNDIEFSLPKPSFSIDTLTHFSEKYPAHEFVLILGSDNLTTFNKWKNFERILERYSIYVYPRPGFSGGKLSSHVKIKITSAPMLEISSTYIRDAIKNKKDVRYMLTESVYIKIKEMHFYEQD